MTGHWPMINLDKFVLYVWAVCRGCYVVELFMSKESAHEYAARMRPPGAVERWGVSS